MAKEKRTNTKLETETTLLTSSARRCCFCYGINNDFSEKAGQIAHIDGDRTNSKLNNLAWLCLEHHDKYDGSTSQSKGYTKNELKSYRNRLYIEVNKIREKSPESLSQNALTIDFLKAYKDVRDSFVLEFDLDTWIKKNDEYEILVESKSHKKVSPMTQVMQKEHDTYREVGVGIENNKNDIIVSANQKFVGKIVIK